MDKKSIKWLIQAIKEYIPLIISLVIATSAISIGFLVLAVVSKNIIDIAIGTKEGSIFTQTLYLLLVVIFQMLLNIYQSMTKARIDGKVKIKLRNKLINKVLRAPLMQTSKIHSGEIMNLFTNDISIVTGTIITAVPNMVSLGVKLIGGLILLAYFDWKFTLICVGLGAIFVLSSFFLKKFFKGLHKQCQELEGKVRSFAQEVVEQKEILQTSNATDSIMNELQRKNIESYKKNLVRNAFSVLSNTGYFLFFSIGYYAGLVWGVWQIKEGLMTFGTLTAFLQIIEQIRTPIRSLSSFLPSIFSMIASLERIMSVTEMDDSSKIKRVEMNEILKLEDISFSYDRDTVLQDFSLSINKGEKIGVFGLSGSGKTTLIKIILGLLEPTEGDYLLNACLERISYVPQGNMLFSGTIRENLTLFSNEYSDEQLYEALELACAREFVDELPEKLDTNLQEKGHGLSEGQLQRLAIARALVMRSELTIFDEATASLDKETEKRLLENLKNIEMTAIWITHKTYTLELCDQSIDLSKKKK